MFKFSAVSQIWKKYIQKLNDWDLPLIDWMIFEDYYELSIFHQTNIILFSLDN